MLTLLALSLFPFAGRAVNNGLARTPQMGWNNWNSLGCDVSQSLLLDTAVKLVELGLRDVGYKYVVLDDCWSDGRSKEGYIQVDKQKFPNGMKWIAEQLHNQDLLYGMYSSAGEQTCAHYEGSLDWEKQDAESWASWDVDYLKYDNCYHKGRFGYPEVSFNRYKAMADALNATGRPILYSLCNWGEDYVNTWGMTISNSWRISGDIYDSFTRPDALCPCTDAADPHCIAPGTHCSVLNIINRVAPYVDRGGPGGWHDLDMLEVGEGKMSDNEYVAHFTMWSAIKSPLLIGTDIRTLNAKALSILNNPAVIAVSQDPIGMPAKRVSRDTNVKKDRYGEGETQIWSGPLYPDDELLVFLNAADEDLQMTTDLEEIFIHEKGSKAEFSWDMYDLWANRMSDTVAEKIIQSGRSEKIFASENWYNSTSLSYADGLKAGDERLMGKKIGIATPGELKVSVPRHSVKAYRLRRHAEAKNSQGKTEL